MVAKHEPRKPSRPRKAPAAAPENLFAGTLWERLAAIGYSIPDEVLERLPKDLAKNFDHYAHGSPRQD